MAIEDNEQVDGYGVLTFAIMRRPGLSPAAKVIAAALASHVRPGREEVYPSVTRLGRLTGLHRSTVMKSLTDLEKDGVIESRKYTGCRTHYRFLREAERQALGETGGENQPVGNNDRSENSTSSENEPVENLDTTGRKKRQDPSEKPTEPVGNSDTEINKETKRKLKRKKKVPFEKILEAYNAAVEGTPLPKASLTDGYRAKLRTRWKEPVFREEYPKIFSLAARTPFFHGRNDRGWKPDFGWLIESEKKYTRVINGFYGTPMAAVAGGKGESGDEWV